MLHVALGLDGWMDRLVLAPIVARVFASSPARVASSRWRRRIFFSAVRFASVNWCHPIAFASCGPFDHPNDTLGRGFLSPLFPVSAAVPRMGQIFRCCAVVNA